MSIRNAAEKLSETKEERRLRVSFETFTPESVEHGDADERGWESEEGISMEPDRFDLEEGLTAVDLAAKYLHERQVEPSSSAGWNPGLWYTQYKAEEDIREGSYTNFSFHPAGFSEEEQAELVEKVRQLRREQDEKVRRSYRRAV